ncbi:MAG: permease [Nitriliruptor sp.]|nr:MAG: permease [Nitriliruptor sp.]
MSTTDNDASSDPAEQPSAQEQATDTRVDADGTSGPTGSTTRRLVVGLLAAAGAWALIYAINERLWDVLIYDLAGLDPETRLGHAVHFFLYDTAKIMLLIIGLIFAISLARSAVPPERVRELIIGRHVAVGFGLAAVFGALTPFCSCSSVPLFIGFVAAGVPLGVTLTFLITSPLINQVGVVMLAGMVGWEIAALYVLTAMTMAVIAGVLLSQFDLERWIDPFVKDITVPTGVDGGKPTLADRIESAKGETVDIVRTVWPYVLVGIGIGAGIHGWVPEDFFQTTGIADSLWSVPVATVAGVPLYANVAGVVPLVEAVYAKGLGLGTAMSFMMSIVALSLPALILLKRVMKLPLLAIFTAVVTTGIIAIGFIFDLIV